MFTDTYCRFRFEDTSPTTIDLFPYASNGAIQAEWVATDAADFQSFFENTIVQQGTYSGKFTAAASEGNEDIVNTVSIAASSNNTFKFYAYSTTGIINHQLVFTDNAGTPASFSIKPEWAADELSIWKRFFLEFSSAATLVSVNLKNIVGGAHIIYLDNILMQEDTVVSITSSAPVLPLSITPRYNQVVTESIAGNRQIAELGDPREVIPISLPNLNESEFYQLVNFFKTTLANNTKSFIFEDFTRKAYKSYDVYLDREPVYQYKKGNKYSVTLNMIEKVS